MPIVGFNGPLDGSSSNGGRNSYRNLANRAYLEAQQRHSTSFQGYSGRLGSSHTPNQSNESQRNNRPVPNQIRNTVRGQSGWSLDTADVPEPSNPSPLSPEVEMSFSCRLGHTTNPSIRNYRQETRLYPAPRVREALLDDEDFWYTPAFEPIYRHLGTEEEDAKNLAGDYRNDEFQEHTNDWNDDFVGNSEEYNENADQGDEVDEDEVDEDDRVEGEDYNEDEVDTPAGENFRLTAGPEEQEAVISDYQVEQ
jgi:hypothetical protein